jgi:UDP-N-acetylglucosamine 3-dehydrogenase
MEPVKMGIIGAGDAGTFHALSFKGKQDARIKHVATCDLNEAAAKKLAAKFNGQSFTDIDAFLKQDMDAVLVAVPHYLHADIVRRVAEAGKHVICEKPMAPTLEECDAMIAATKKAGVKFMIAENHRFLPAHQKMRELIANGVIGDVYLGRTYEGAFMDANNWQFTFEKGGGGVLSDQGVHKFAMLNYLLGSEVVSGQAWLGKAINSPANKGEDNAIMNLRFKSGAMIDVIVSSSTVHPLNNNTELHGTKGHMLEDHSWDKPIRLFSSHALAEKKGQYYDIAVEHGPYPKYYLISAFHEDTHFATCIQEDKDPEFTPAQAKEAVAVVLLGYLSAKKGAPATMDELKGIAASKGTRQLLKGLESAIQQNYPTIKW